MSIPKEYIIVRKPVRHARINVNEKQQVKFIIPNSFSDDEIERLVAQKSSWINEQLSMFKSELSLPVEVPASNILFLGEPHPKPRIDVEKWYKKQAKEYLVGRVDYLAKKNNFKFNRLFIRDTQNKWGNCSTNNNISLNWRLVKAPVDVIDYVILHELCHTIILKHTHAFWLKLSTVCPTYQFQSDWLKTYGKSLF